MSAFNLAQINAELAIAAKLGQPTMFTAATDPQVRRRLIREAILEIGLEHHDAGLHDGKHETWSQLFRRMYGERLQPKNKLSNKREKPHVRT